MKLGLKKKKLKLLKKSRPAVEEEEEETSYLGQTDTDEEEETSESEDDEESGASDDSWMIQDPKKQKAALKQSKDMAQGRVPTVWLQDGETKIFRFLDDGPIATLFRYSVKNRRGFFDKYTQPSAGRADLFRDELNLKPSLCAVYEVVDKTGYKAKTGPTAGKLTKNVNRFFEASGKVYEQLEMMRANGGPLNKYDIKVTRSGTEKNTAYMFFAMPRTALPPEYLAKRLKKDFKKYYAPKSEAEQRLLCRVAGATVSEE